MTDETSRRRVLACVGTSLAVGLAGCSGGGNETNTDGGSATGDGGGDGGSGSGDGGDEAAGEGGTTTGSKPLTLGLIGSSDYKSEVVTVESLTFVAASADAESPTIDVGEKADISKAEYQEPVIVADDMEVPYGTYESVEMTVTPEEVIDSEGSSVDVSGGTVSRTFMELDDEPNTVEQSQFDATLTLYLSIKSGQFKVTGYKSTALG